MALPIEPTRVVFFTGKGGVGKTTIAAALAAELARRGFPVHLTTTDPAAHVAAAMGDATPGVGVSRIDAVHETAACADEVLTAASSLDARARALLEEGLRSPCTEEVAVFRAFARVVLVTLPEATPVHEAMALQDDLRRAGIAPFAWVVNQSFAVVDTHDPVLRARGVREHRYLGEIRQQFAGLLAVAPWAPIRPVGQSGLRAFIDASALPTAGFRVSDDGPTSEPSSACGLRGHI